MSDHVVKVGDQEFRTGLIKPDKIPLSYSQFPAEKVLDLDGLKSIYKIKGRKPSNDLYTDIFQQGRRSSCCPYACTTAGAAKRAFAGKQKIQYGPEWLYQIINGGEDAGALLDDAMDAYMEHGCALRESVPYQMVTTDQAGMSMEAVRFATQEALKYRSLDWVQMPHGDPDACWASTLTNVAMRDPVLMAVQCDGAFFQTGSDGRHRAARGYGNHAVTGIELIGVLQARSLRDIKILTYNSHGKEFGFKGKYLHTYDHMVTPSQYHQHCACQAMRTSPSERSATWLKAA